MLRVPEPATHNLVSDMTDDMGSKLLRYFVVIFTILTAFSN